MPVWPDERQLPGGLRLVGGQLLLVGDAITCPIQLEEHGWDSSGDVDADAAEQTRAHLWADLSDGRVRGVGSRFPGLRPR